ncbi:MAG: CBS domain-containing protein, partial [Candidatus Woesearchaeota archaeon]
KDCVLIEPFTCKESESVVEVAKKLRKTTLRHVFVVNDAMLPTGIISVIDINNRVVAEGRDANKLQAKDIMSKPVDLIDVNDELDAAAKLFASKNRVMNPVVKDQKMVGILTVNEIFRHSEEK